MKLSYEFKKFCLISLIGTLIFSLTGCSRGAKAVVRDQIQLQQYSIDTDVFTTLHRTVVPAAKPAEVIGLDEISKYEKYGYGNWTFGGPLKAETRTDIMPALYDAATVVKKIRH